MTADLLTAVDLAERTTPVRFAPSPEFALPLSDVRADTAGHLATGLGLLGADSPLPLALADALALRADPLLDDLHHARISALVDGLRAADLARTLDGDDPWSRRIAALTGLTHLSSGPASTPATNLSSGPASTPAPNLSSRPASTPAPNLSSGPATHWTAVRLAPLLAAPDRGLRSLGLAIHRLLGRTGPAPALRCELRPGALTPLGPEQRTRLGGPAARLGDRAVLGAAIRLPSTAARLFLGSLPADVPLAPIRRLIDHFLPEPLALDLVVDRPAPPPVLGHHRLGRP